jgi:phosphatidylglycerophosphate synthase
MKKTKRIPVQKQKRINDILLGPLERPALQWLCAHLPAWVTPDILTATGVVGAALVTLGFVLTAQDKNFLWLVNFGIFVNWFGDSLDGSLARYRKIERPRYGFFVDHTFDAISQVLVFVGFAASPYVRFDVAMLGLVVYLLMDVLALARMSVQGIFKISYGKVGPTEVRAIVILMNTLVYFWNPSFPTPLGPFSLWDFCLSLVGIGFAFVFLYNTLKLTKKLRDIDQQPQG